MAFITVNPPTISTGEEANSTVLLFNAETFHSDIITYRQSTYEYNTIILLC